MDEKPVGRPRLYKTPEALQASLDAIFDKWDKDKTPYTITGLNLELGFESRQALTEYGKLYPEFSSTVKKAKARVENYLEKHLFQNNVTGSIFNLKNNFGWKDKTESELSTKDDKPIAVTLWGKPE